VMAVNKYITYRKQTLACMPCVTESHIIQEMFPLDDSWTGNAVNIVNFWIGLIKHSSYMYMYISDLFVAWTPLPCRDTNTHTTYTCLSVLYCMDDQETAWPGLPPLLLAFVQPYAYIHHTERKRCIQCPKLTKPHTPSFNYIPPWANIESSDI